jgi:mRNA-degrading endonuclease RelE of RelBE toxin-antitoxin system
METKAVMYNYAEKIQADFEAKTKELLKAQAEPRRFKKLNRERHDIIMRARRLNVNLRHV